MAGATAEVGTMAKAGATAHTGDVAATQNFNTYGTQKREKKGKHAQ